MVDSPTPRADGPAVLAPGLLTAALVLFFGFRGTGGEAVDFWFQSFFWDGQVWLVPKNAGLFHAIAYTGPKILIILWAVFLIGAAMFPVRAPGWINRRRALYLLLCLAVIPVVCTQLRAVSHMATPSALAPYGGGRWAHLLLFEPKPPGYPSNAFPAGHASGGFALLSLCFAWAGSGPRRRGMAVALLVGGWMGLYQVARGEHFLSHTLVTASLAWFFCAVFARLIRPDLPRLSCSAS